MSTSSLASSTATTTTNTFNDSVGLNGSSAALQCRVQYLDDTDPFASVNLPEPARPPSFTFLTSTILSNQLSSVQKVLNAPHKVIPPWLCREKSIEQEISPRLGCWLYTSIMSTRRKQIWIGPVLGSWSNTRWTTRRHWRFHRRVS